MGGGTQEGREKGGGEWKEFNQGGKKDRIEG